MTSRSSPRAACVGVACARLVVAHEVYIITPITALCTTVPPLWLIA